MAKVAFSKLKCKVNEEIKVINFAGEDIEVKQYLPVQDKLSLIGQVIMAAHDQDNNYANPVKINVYANLEIVFAYTNISFTEKQKEDTPKLYDAMLASGLLDLILDTIPGEELALIYNGIDETVSSVYQYQNSAVGLMENIKASLNQTDFDTENLAKELEKLQNNSVLKDVLPLLGLQ